MKLFYVVLLAVVLAGQLASVQANAWAIARIAVSVIGTIIVVTHKDPRVVEIHNEGEHHAHLWCASRNDRIGDENGLWVAPGEKIVWTFRKHLSTQFWCTLDWNGQRVGWDVYVSNWWDAPNPTKWSIKNDGVYDQWRNRKWRNL